MKMTKTSKNSDTLKRSKVTICGLEEETDNLSIKMTENSLNLEEKKDIKTQESEPQRDMTGE